MVDILTGAAEKCGRHHFFSIQDMVWDWYKITFSSYEMILKTCAIYIFFFFHFFALQRRISLVDCCMFDDSKWNMKLRNNIYVLPFPQIIEGSSYKVKPLKTNSEQDGPWQKKRSDLQGIE